MGKTAFVFSGQGDQYPGMGKELATRYPVAAEVFKICDSLRAGTSVQCFEGSGEELKETKNTQPCLFAVELAAVKVLESEGIKADMMAGFSLGEVVAATAAGYMDDETGFRTVCRRGELMGDAAGKCDAAMAAVVKLTDEQVEAVCKEYEQVYPVNYNCPGQVTVAGLSESMKDFRKGIKAAGGRALPLNVKGGFHSPFMDEAASAFAQELEKVAFKKGHTVLYSNLTGDVYPENVKDTLSAQINNPVKWEKIIRNMIDAGVDKFIEIGPGTTLTGMINKISEDVKTYSVSDMAEILSDLK